jgi:CDP-glycerol glycerophosphotransferase (TagB/SpsB family)
MHKSAAFLYGVDFQYIDHIAPLADLLSIPLIITTDFIQSLLTEFYPQVRVELAAQLTFSESIVKNYDVIFTCFPKKIFDPLFFFEEHKLRKKLLTIWLPHGNSDKENLSGLSDEKIILTYGKQMVDILSKKNILPNFYQHIVVGNYRAKFFEKNKKFYDSLLAKKLSFPKKQKTILYAPTWGNPDVEEALSFILKNLPPHYNLFIKLHPNTLIRGLYSGLKEKYEEAPNIKFLNEFPLIYPLLDKTDILIADYSSVSYDFLYFDRPIFFLTREKTPIQHTGYITSLETLFEDLKKPDIYTEARKALFNYAFEKNTAYEALPNIIKTTYETYFENELHFL